MTATELKTEILKIIDNLPESTLLDILKHIRTIKEPNSTEHFIEKIFKEDDNLLKRLSS